MSIQPRNTGRCRFVSTAPAPDHVGNVLVGWLQEVFCGEVDEERSRASAAGIFQQIVDAAEIGHRFFDQAPYGFGVGHTSPGSDRPSTRRISRRRTRTCHLMLSSMSAPSRRPMVRASQRTCRPRRGMVLMRAIREAMVSASDQRRQSSASPVASALARSLMTRRCSRPSAVPDPTIRPRMCPPSEASRSRSVLDLQLNDHRGRALHRRYQNRLGGRCSTGSRTPLARQEACHSGIEAHQDSSCDALTVFGKQPSACSLVARGDGVENPLMLAGRTIGV